MTESLIIIAGNSPPVNIKSPIDINSSDTYDYIDPEEITLIKLSEDNGATYEVQDNTWTINADFEPTVDVEKIRISPVTKYVFGEYPKYIRINVTNRV